MEVVDYLENQDNFIGFALVEMMSGKMDEIQRKRGFNPQMLKVECQIDGIEVDFMKPLLAAADQYENLVKEEAKKMIRSRYADISQLMDSLEEVINLGLEDR